MRNIVQYCKCSVPLTFGRTHTPDQSAYNLVELSITTLSQKLAGTTLPIDKFDSHLNFQGKVMDQEFAIKAFRYTSDALCNLRSEIQSLEKL